MRKLIASLTLVSFLFTTTLAYADEPESENAPVPQLNVDLDLRITDLSEGSPAPFSGVLLTTDSMAKIEYDHALALALLTNRHSYQLQRLQLRLDAETTLRESERQLHEEIFASQLSRIESLEEIAVNKRPDWVLPVAILTAFVVGAGVTVGITYAVNQQ